MILTRLTGWSEKLGSPLLLLFAENTYGTKSSIKRTAKSQHISALNGIKANQCAEIQTVHTKGCVKAPIEANTSLIPSISPSFPGTKTRKLQAAWR